MTNTTASASSRSGIGFTGLLTIVFVVLKLNPGGHLDSPVEDWSWWLVLSPILFWVLFIGLIIGIATIAALLDVFVFQPKRAKRDRELRQNRRF